MAKCPMARCMKRAFLLQLALLISFLTISVTYSWQFVFSKLYHNITAEHPNSSITVLFWHWPYGNKNNLTGDVCLKDYSIPRCVLVDNHSNFENANLVVFHHAEIGKQKVHLLVDLPRPASQRWVWFSLEAPPNIGNLNLYKNLFNLTMSYHPDADITVPYGKLIAKEKPCRDFDIPKNKSYEACWVVSNYQKWHRRSVVFQELKNILDVQVYGHFTKKLLSNRDLLPTISRCYFYLAFENVVSPHYITEKLWKNAFQGGAVPVVLGPPRKDYEAVVPPESFIHVDDFNSTADLAVYLRSLIKEPEKYNAYFNWRQNYTVKLYKDWRERLCNICPLYKHFPAQKIYKDLRTLTKW